MGHHKEVPHVPSTLQKCVATVLPNLASLPQFLQAVILPPTPICKPKINN
jgi:hypothetical protein